MNSTYTENITLTKEDALIVVDVQKDFLPGGNLAVPRGDRVIPAFNRYLGIIKKKDLPVFNTRDWHPPGHCSFKEQGGPWPPHCIAESDGARFPDGLNLPPSAVIISKGTTLDKDAYSGFEGTDLDKRLKSRGVRRLLIGGLATDYCVLNTVRDALRLGYEILLLKDAIQAVNLQPEDGKKAEEEMIGLGAVPVKWEMFS